MYWALLVKNNLQKGVSLPERLNLSKNEIARSFNLPVEESPHRAMKGVEHLMACYQVALGVKFQNKHLQDG